MGTNNHSTPSAFKQHEPKAKAINYITAILEYSPFPPFSSAGVDLCQNTVSISRPIFISRSFKYKTTLDNSGIALGRIRNKETRPKTR